MTLTLQRLWHRPLIALAVLLFTLGCAADRDGPAPHIASVSPNEIIVANGDVTVIITGTDMSPVVEDGLTDDPVVVMPRVTLIGDDGVEYEIPDANISLPPNDTSGTALVIIIPEDFLSPTEPGEPDAYYDVRVTNADGQSDILENAILVKAPELPFDILGIDPPFGCTCATTTVTITSAGHFVSTPEVYLGGLDTLDDNRHYLTRVAFVDSSTLTALVPEGIPVGTYDVVVDNPPSAGNRGILEDAFRVVTNPVPVVTGIVPGRGNTQDDTPVSIFGENFRGPLRIDLLDQDDAVAVSVTASVVSDGEITATFPTTDMTTGPYLVRVVNEDEETYFTFSGFLVTNPSGNLETFVTDSTMTTARRMLTGLSGTDDIGNRFIFAIGGDTGAGGEVLDTVELAQLSKYGSLSAWREQAARLNTPRAGAASVAVPIYAPGKPFIPLKTYIYVLGGIDNDGTVLDTIERAVLLGGGNAPMSLEATVHTEPGTLAAGYWYYKIAAVLADTDPDNPGGETLVSDEAILRVDEGAAVHLSWDPVTINGSPATLYRVYRTDEANGASAQEHLIGETTETEFVDDGLAAGTASPMGVGATGGFVEVGTMTTPRWGFQAVLAPDENGDRHIVAMGGKSSEAGGVLGSVERAPVDDEGVMGTFDTAGMTPMTDARAFFAAAVETSDNVSTFNSDASRLWVLAGIDTSLATFETLEESDVDSGGNGAWTINGKRAPTVAGSMAVIVNQKLFLMGGATDADDTTFGSVIGTGRDTEFDDAGGITDSINSTSSALLEPRAFGVGIPGAGFIFFIGGTSDGSNAVATTERTF